MVKILDDNYMKIIKCYNCGKSLSFDSSKDLFFTEECLSENGEYKSGLGLCCPNCGEIILGDECNALDFPKAFYHFSENELDASTIQNYLIQVYNYLKQHEDEMFYYIATANTIVMGLRFTGENSIQFIVAQNYYDQVIDDE